MGSIAFDIPVGVLDGNVARVLARLTSIDEDVKQVVEAGGSQNQLKALFRKQRGKYLQEAALAQVEEGETSVQEVLRVMKAGDEPPPGTARAKPRQPAT